MCYPFNNGAYKFSHRRVIVVEEGAAGTVGDNQANGEGFVAQKMAEAYSDKPSFLSFNLSMSEDKFKYEIFSSWGRFYFWI